MTYIVSGGALNSSTHSLTLVCRFNVLGSCKILLTCFPLVSVFFPFFSEPLLEDVSGWCFYNKLCADGYTVCIFRRANFLTVLSSRAELIDFCLDFAHISPTAAVTMSAFCLVFYVMSCES